MRRRLTVLLAVVGLIASACGGSGDGLGSATASGDAAADVEGVPTGCAPIIELANGPGDFEAGVLTEDDIREMIEQAEQAKGFVAPESAAAEAYFQLIIDIGEAVLADFDLDPDLTSDQAARSLLGATDTRQADLADLQIEVIAYLDRTCGVDVSDPVALGSDGDGDPADGSATTQPGIAMDDGETGDGETGDADGDAGPDETTVPIAPVLDIDQGSVGATGSFGPFDVEIGEIWRTNQLPSEALTGSGDGTAESWTLVEARLTNDGGASARVPDGFLRWRDAGGEPVSPVEVLSPQGAEPNLLLDDQTSVQTYFVFPGEVGAGDGATIEIVGQGVVPEIIPIGQGPASSVYPVTLAVGDAGSATYKSSACTYDVETEVRGAFLALDAVVNSRWNRSPEGRRFVYVDLAITLVDASGPSICPGTNTTAFQLETRLEQSNGDRVASDKSFEAIDLGETYVDRLIFDVAADTTSLRLVASANGETLATWTDLMIPAP